MSIDVAQSFRGYLASQPVQSPEGDHMRADAVVGQSRYRRTPDGELVRMEPDLCHLVMRGAASLRALTTLRVGDEFIAAGTLGEEPVFNTDTDHMEQRPVFEADAIGPNAASLSFDLAARRRIHSHPEIAGPTRPTGPTQPVGMSTPPGQPTTGAPTL